MPDWGTMMSRAKAGQTTSDATTPAPKEVAVPPGVAMMLKSFGLSAYVEGINGLLQSGALQKIVEFSDQVGPINAKLDVIAGDLAYIRRQLGGYPAEPGPDPGADSDDRSGGGDQLRAFADGDQR